MRRHFACGSATKTALMYIPGVVIERWICVAPAMMTSSQISMCPLMHRRAADLAVPSDPRAARDADAPGDRRMRADPAVVADLDLVVELDVVLDHRIVDRAAIDRRVGADLHVRADHDATDLRDLDPAAVRLGHAEAVGSDHGARMQNATRTHDATVVDRHAGVQQSVVADR